MIARLVTLYEAGGVRRMHTLPVREPQSVAAHTYGAMIIAAELCRANRVGEGPVFRSLLYHDAPEVATGDVPAHVKREAPGVREAYDRLEAQFYDVWDIPRTVLGEKEALIAKSADTLELLFAMLHEKRTGNRHGRIYEVFNRALSYLREAEKELEGVSQLTRYLTKEWADA